MATVFVITFFFTARNIEIVDITGSASALSVYGIAATLRSQIFDKALHYRIVRPANQRSSNPLLLYEIDDNKCPAVVRQS